MEGELSATQDIEPYNVLFLCNSNVGRSLIAEAILNKDGGKLFRAYSAGTTPAGAVNPYAIETLEADGYATEGLRSKSWREFTVPGAPEMDFVFTLCDEAAGEPLPVWPGDPQPVTAHWGIEDPSLVEGSPIDKETAFETAFHYIRNRVLAFAALPLSTLDHLSLHSHLEQIGQQDGASAQRAKAG